MNDVKSRVRGTVKFFNQSRGFGFITLDDGGSDVFVHVSSIATNTILNEGDKVTFDVVDDRRGKGKQAANVQLD